VWEVVPIAHGGDICTVSDQELGVALTWTRLRSLSAAESSRRSELARSARAQFIAGRTCAATAQRALGVASPSLKVRGRRPVWPSGLTGSISHTTGLALAFVARRDRICHVGIDSEASWIRGPRLEEYVLTPSETRAMRHLPTRERAERTTLLFSAKEALFKCVSPFVARTFDVSAVNVDVIEEWRLAFRVQATSVLSDRSSPVVGAWRWTPFGVVTLAWVAAAGLRPGDGRDGTAQSVDLLLARCQRRAVLHYYPELAGVASGDRRWPLLARSLFLTSYPSAEP
jgi:4'-phosphopantetheinyl transferase EntD